MATAVKPRTTRRTKKEAVDEALVEAIEDGSDAHDNGGVALGAADIFGAFELPYTVEVTVAGVKTYFFSRPDMDEWEKKENSAPGSRARKETDPESLVWRDADGYLAFPSTQIKTAMIAAGRYSPDPSKTGRRSAAPFISEALNVAEDVITFHHLDGEGYETWNEIDVRIVRYANGRFGPRRRPILHPGWHATFTLQVLVPELIRPGDVGVLINRAGMVRGVGDNTKFGAGRFTVATFGTPEPAHW